MWRIALLFVGALALGSLSILAMAVWAPLAQVMRTVLRGLVMLVGLGGLALGVAGIEQEAWWAAILGGGIILVALRWGWSLRRHHRRPAERSAHIRPDVPARAEGPWDRFERALDWVGRQQTRRSRKAITGFLAERDSPSLSHDQRALLLSCEKRVPELIQTCLERCRNASPRERDRYIDETLARLDRIAAEAERARQDVREADDRRLQVLHRYFDGVVPGDDDRPRQP